MKVLKKIQTWVLGISWPMLSNCLHFMQCRNLKNESPYFYLDLCAKLSCNTQWKESLVSSQALLVWGKIGQFDGREGKNPLFLGFGHNQVGGLAGQANGKGRRIESLCRLDFFVTKPSLQLLTTPLSSFITLLSCDRCLFVNVYL